MNPTLPVTEAMPLSGVPSFNTEARSKHGDARRARDGYEQQTGWSGRRPCGRRSQFAPNRAKRGPTSLAA
jgi:hypothetical protein